MRDTSLGTLNQALENDFSFQRTGVKVSEEGLGISLWKSNSVSEACNSPNSCSIAC